MKSVKKRRRLLFCLLLGILFCLSAVNYCLAESTEANGGNGLLITFKTGVTKHQAKKVMKKVNVIAKDKMFQRKGNTLLLRLDSSEMRRQAISRLKKESAVASVQPNYRYNLGETSSSGDSFIDRQWNLDYMDVPEAWDLIDKVKPQALRDEKDKVIVATLDTGVDYQHPDLQKNVAIENCVTVADRESPYPVYGKALPSSHGTGTAGIIAATSNNGIGIAGIAAGNHNDLISLMAINVFHSEGYTSQASASTVDIIKGIEYACAKGAKVINMCLGHSEGDSDLFGLPHDDAALEAAINDAVYKKDVVIVCSAGNNGDARIWYPSDFDATISVINTKKYKNAWSRKCKTGRSNFGSSKDISAPGRGVYTTGLDGSYKKGCGTSMAAPSVAAVAALVRYVNPQLSAAEVKEILYSTATDLYKPGYDIYTGHGNVNACRAVAAAAGVSDGLKVPQLARPKSVKAYSAGPHAIKLSWKKVPRANGYFIYRSDKKDGSYHRIKRIRRGKILSFRDTGRKFDKKFYYKIVAYGTTRDGKKALSPESRKVTSRPRAEVPSLKTANRDYRAIHLSWKKSTGTDGYEIYRSDTKNGDYQLIQTISQRRPRSWTDRELTVGKTYYYKMRSYCFRNGKHYYSELSPKASAKVRPAQPAFSVKKVGRKIILKRKESDPSQISGCQIYRRTEERKWRLIKTMPVEKRRFTDRNLTPGKKYFYKIRTYKTVQGKRVYSKTSKVKSRRL